MKTATASTKASDIKREWRLVDLQGKTLGRATTEIAKILMGKGKPYFIRNLDCGDYIVVVNVKEVRVTGNKEKQKKYYRYSGYPGGLSVASFAEVMKKNPRDIVVHAVKGMLPQNKLRDRMLKRLFIYQDDKHPYQEKFKKNN